jgi:serine kinase of HPr protein (carbohydrate metabolism regulator)
MAKTDRTIEDIRIEVAAERQRAAEALDRLGNDVNDIIADLQRQAVEAGRKAAMVAPAVVVAAGAFVVLRRRRRARKAGGSTQE